MPAKLGPAQDQRERRGLLDQLIHEAVFSVSKALYQQILEQEREV